MNLFHQFLAYQLFHNTDMNNTLRGLLLKILDPQRVDHPVKDHHHHGILDKLQGFGVASLGAWALNNLGAPRNSPFGIPDTTPKKALINIPDFLLGGTTGFWFQANRGEMRFEAMLNSTLKVQEEHMATWNATLRHFNEYHEVLANEKDRRFEEHKASMEQFLAAKHQQLEETKSSLEKLLSAKDRHLQETKSSLKDLQLRMDQQYMSFLVVAVSLVVFVVVLLIFSLYQSLSNNRERHQLMVTHHLQYETTLKDKIQLQQKQMEEQKESLVKSVEQQRQQLQYSPYHMQHHQPLVLTLPASPTQISPDRPANNTHGNTHGNAHGR